MRHRRYLGPNRLWKLGRIRFLGPPDRRHLGDLLRKGHTAGYRGGQPHRLHRPRRCDQSDLLFQTPDTTWQAYNQYGGNSLYGIPPCWESCRAFKVSYNRPFNTAAVTPQTWLFSTEYPMVRWLEANGYDVSYISGVDTDRLGPSTIQHHKVFLSVGNDEYWSGQQRANVEAARAAGVHLAFFSGNAIFWKTRWESSIFGTAPSYRTLVTYKETLANAVIDPADPPTWTGTWRDPRFSPPADGNRPENALSGTIFMVNGVRHDAITVPQRYGALRFWRNTDIATLPVAEDGWNGKLATLPRSIWRRVRRVLELPAVIEEDGWNGKLATLPRHILRRVRRVLELPPINVARLPTGTLGLEWDEDLDNGSRPPGLIRLSSTTVKLRNEYLLDHGGTYGPGTATHALTLYRHSSGALVFGAGTMQWSWGLDDNHTSNWAWGPAGGNRRRPRPDVRMQQATVNLFADMGVQPATLQAGLLPAAASTDSVPPTAIINAPAAGSALQADVPITVTGTASDSGGGIVAAVEVSVDGGRTWHPATGMATWTYAWTPTSSGPVTIQARAVDDSANIGTPASVAVTVVPIAPPTGG